MKSLISFIPLFLLFLFLRIPSLAEKNYDLRGKFVIILDIQEFATKEMMNADSAKNLIDAVNKVIELSDSDKVIYIESIMAALDISYWNFS